MQKKMTIEIRNETPAFNESFVSTIELPALPLALRDAEQRARLPRDPDPPLPARDRSLDLAVFRLLVAESPVNDSMGTYESAEWIKLPVSEQEARCVALRHNEGCMEDCTFYEFETAIPQIGNSLFHDMEDFQLLNEIAEKYLKMPDISRIRFKAALEHDKASSLTEVKDIMEHERQYSIDLEIADEDDFLKRYLAFFTDTRIDSRWFSSVYAYTEGAALLERMDGAITSYGACSARDKTLVEIVPYDNPQEEQIEESNMTMGGM